MSACDILTSSWEYETRGDEQEQPEEDEVRGTWGSSSHVHVTTVEEPTVRRLREETQVRCTTPAPGSSYNAGQGSLQ
jgi:hypothetical protein